MLIEFTPEEQRHIEQIQKKYALEMEKAEKNKKAQNIYDAMAAELDLFSDKCQKKRFKRIAEGGTLAIINSVKEQAPLLLDLLHKDTLTKWGKIPETDEKHDYYTFKEGKLYISQAYALEVLKSEMRLHINALIDDKKALQEVFTILKSIIRESPLTDDQEPPEDTTSLIKASASEKLSTPYFKKYAFMNSHVTNKIITDTPELNQEIDGQFRLYFRVDQSTKKQIQTLVCLTFKGEVENRLSRRLTGYDRAVLNAVSNIFYYTKLENPSAPYVDVTLVGIWRHLQGKQLTDDTTKPKKAQLDRIQRSIEKMRFIDFTMDVKEEVENNLLDISKIGKRYIRGFYIKDYMINCTEYGVITTNGKEAAGYRINNIIPLIYNVLRKNIISIDFDLLDTSEALSDSEGVIEIKQYLLQQIALMKNKKRNSNRILLDTIYTAAGIEAPEDRLKDKAFNSEEYKKVQISRTKKADRDKIEKILSVWKGKAWITNYTPVTKGREVIGYDIGL